MLNHARRIALLILMIFLMPAIATAGWWISLDRPGSWRQADWSASGLLPPATANSDAAIYVMSARTGGLKGALSTHSWIVMKRAGADSYTRFDKVGWGMPVRRNHRPADGRWYSNEPEIVGELTGPKAQRLIPEIEAAIDAYPYNHAGGYRIYPGPNSNTFVAHVLRAVPELDIVLPANAVGRDYIGDRLLAVDADGRDLHMSLFGYAGLSLGERSGFEVNLLGLVVGIGVDPLTLKLPAIGDFKIRRRLDVAPTERNQRTRSRMET